jgi:hypothetical protein
VPQYRHERHFSAEEANALIPRLTILLVKLQEAIRVLEGQRQVAVAALRLAQGNGKSHPLPDVDGLELVREIVGEIEGFGCVVKGFDDPLIDFPSIKDGDEVYLCWRLGEPEVLSWHPLDGGFAARKPL